MLKKITAVATIIIIFSACQKVVDADGLLDTDEKVFISSFIAPQDTVLRVNISKAFPSIGTPLSVNDWNANEDKFLVKNAEVTISNETGTSTNLVYSEENKSYLADPATLAIIENQSYFLKVIVDGTEYNASCRIPKKITEIKTEIKPKENNFGYNEADLNLSFKDFAKEKNFYVLGGFLTTTYQYEDNQPEIYTYLIYFDTDKFQTDNIANGANISGKAVIYPNNNNDEILLQVANVEETLYHYLKSTSTNAINEGNPFLEYAITPNNIQEKGAIGVFAGYQLTEKVIQID